MTESVNMRETVQPKSDQLNADDLIGTTITIKITAVKHCGGDQPIAIHFEGDNGKPYKPCKSMRRVLIHAWGDDGAAYVGKRATLYCDPEVKFGGIKVGGIRISHLSDISRTMDIALTATRGKRTPYQVKPLADAAPQPAQPTTYPEDKFAAELPKMQAAIASGKSTLEKIIAFCAKTAPLTDEQIARLTPAPVANEDETY